MKDCTITELLKRFMDGTTSLEEEARLAEFFRHATDGDKPDGISAGDWQAYKEMFRQFDEGFEEISTAPKHKKARILPLWRIASAAAAAVVIITVSATLLMRHEQTVVPQMAEVIGTDTIAGDTTQINDMETIREKPEKRIKPQRQQRLPYTMPVPRTLMAQSHDYTMTREDSIAIAVKEAEAIVEAMTIYQDMKISEICNVEYTEEEY